MEKIIELKSVELIDILGIGDANIKLIESNIPVSISARGEQLTIKGDSTDITEADAILKEMRETLSSKGALYKDDVDNLIKLSKTGSANLNSVIKDNHVIYKLDYLEHASSLVLAEFNGRNKTVNVPC